MARVKSFNKEEILRKATELFWKKGFHGTSIQELVEYTGLSRSSLYDTYGDKYNLFIETLKSYQEKTRKSLATLPQQNNIKNFIQQFLDSRVAISLKDQDHKGCFLANCSVEMAPHDQKVCDITLESMDAFVERFTPVFEKGITDGEINTAKKPRALARYLFNTVTGLLVIGKTTQDPKILNEIVETSMNAIF